MPPFWKKFSLLFAIMILGVILASIPSFASASQQSDRLLPTPVPPEPYPYSNKYPAVVYLEKLEELQILYSMNVDIEGLQPVEHTPQASGIKYEPSIATIYIDSSQARALAQVGLIAVPIPNEGYRSFLAYGPGSGALNAWPTFAEYVTRMQNLAFSHPDIVRLKQIGSSVLLRPLYCMKITDNPDVDEDEPEFKYTANHHGNETTGIEMVMRLAELLANRYGIDPTPTELVDEMEIWLCPIYNPDGYVAGTRYNAHGVDLNRDFPDRFTDPVDTPTGREPETRAYMYLGYEHRFVMGANYHGGAEVLNYPWDAVVPPGYLPVPAYAPDDTLYYDFGYGYTSRNTDLWNGGFPQGMTRGWEWYQIWGGMQDWAYYYRGEHHVTLEISSYSPPFEQMDTYWDHNRDAMLWWMSQALTGVRGRVLDASNSTPLNATITLVGRGQPNTILTDPDAGDYQRVISPGSYTLNASTSCYQSQSVEVVVAEDEPATIQDFYLDPIIDLSPSTKTSSVSHAKPGDIVNYQVRVENACNSTIATITDTLPSEVTWTGDLTATQGIPVFEDGQILWQGEITQSQPVMITYAVSMNQCLVAGTSIINLTELYDGVGSSITRTVDVEVDNVAPGVPALLTPIDDSINQPITTTLSWAPSSDLNCDGITYDVAFAQSSRPGIIAEGLSSPGYNPGPLLPATIYYWQVIARDGLTSTASPIWSFSTALPVLKIYLPLGIKG